MKRLREFIQRGTAVRLKRAAEKIAALKKSDLDLQTLGGEIDKEIRALLPLLGEDLTRASFGGFVRGVADVAEYAASKPALAPAAALTPKPAPPLSTIAPEALSLVGLSRNTLAHFPALNDALRVLDRSPVAVGIDYRDTAAKVRAGAFAVTADVTEDAVADIKDVLVEALREGKSRDEFIDEVQVKLGLDPAAETGRLSASHLETIFRTNVQAALSDGNYRAVQQPMVVDAFPYVAYYATHDARVRDEHAELEKLGLQGTNYYRIDDPTFIKFRPPWSYNCRCAWVVQSVEQAANKGVKEAIEWLGRAKAIAAEKGGSFYQYLSATRPTAPEYVTPPKFEPPPEFKRVA